MDNSLAPATATTDPESTASPASVQPDSPRASSPSSSASPRRAASSSNPVSDTSSPSQCFICLQTSEETPDESWVNPCPCSLEAHETCMLQWVTEFEANEGSKKKMRCPACKNRIRVVEPYDSVVRLNDSLHFLYSRAAPPMLLMLLTLMAGAGSAWYGMTSFAAFGGVDSLSRWLRVDYMLRKSGRPLLLGDRLAFYAKSFALQMIAPTLLIYRALPFFRSTGAIASMILGACLTWRGEMPRWPPTAGWAICFFPFLSMTYNNLYYELFGHFERRLDRRLRGRPAEEEAAAQPPPDIQRPGRAVQQPAQGPVEVGAVQEHRGLLGAVWGLAQAILGLAVLEDDDDDHDHEVVQLELEVNIGEPQDGWNGQMEEMVIVGQGDGDPPNAQDAQAAQEEQEVRPRDNGDEADQPAMPAAPAIVVQPVEAVEAQDAPAAQGRAAEERVEDLTTNILTRILNATVSQLMLPFVCATAGELLRVTLPTRLVTKSRWGQPGLLQQRWGRSLIGGCVYIVARDAVTLYGKYRRLQVKNRRKVKNVPRRKKPRNTPSVTTLSD